MADDLAGLERDLAKAGPRPVYLVQGDERLLVDEAVARLLAAAVDDPRDSLAVTRVDLAEGGRGAKDVLAACRSLGLFATRQAVLVRAADVLDKKAADRDELAAYVEAPDPATTLILVASKLDGKSALVRRIKKAGGLLTFAAPKPWQVPVWVQEEARRLGHAMDRATAQLVAELAGTGLQQLRQVVEQLSLYVGPGRPIDAAAAETLLSATRAHTVFELVDALGERRLAPALGHLHAMLDHREPPLRILSMLVRHFRQLWQAAEARAAGADPSALQELLGVHPFVAKKLHGQAARFDEPTLRRAWDLLYRAEVGLKSSGLDAPTVMERLVMDLCA